MKITKVSDRNVIFTIPENADFEVNIGLILGSKHNYIIDTGMGASSVKPVLEYLAGNVKPIIVINTHAHSDHVMGNWVLQDRLIVAHKLCRKILDEQWERIAKETKESKDYFDQEIRKCLPNLVFEGSMEFADEGISLFHTPGHTEDGISIYDEVDRVLYIGDNFGVFDGVAELWVKEISAFGGLLETYQQYDFVTCIPSHCAPQTRAVIPLLEAALLKGE